MALTNAARNVLSSWHTVQLLSANQNVEKFWKGLYLGSKCIVGKLLYKHLSTIQSCACNQPSYFTIQKFIVASCKAHQPLWFLLWLVFTN
jgi:hypothetical protein